jgi:hypothetical protein
MRRLLPRFVLVLGLLATGIPLFAQTAFYFKETDGVSYAPLRPSSTDPAITEHNDPHWVYIDHAITQQHDPRRPADRQELLLWIPGTKPPNSRPTPSGKLTQHASHTFCLVAASLGYHVISLSYPNLLSASICNDDADPKAFENFRMTIIQGGKNPHITINRWDSIENRLIRVLQTLAQRLPQEGWDTYLNADHSIRWEKIAVAGQSQGGGHAALIGLHHKVARVLCFGAPKDFSIKLNAPAAWYGEESATPKELFFSFNHMQDRQGCTPEHQLDNLKALRLDQFGAQVYVDGAQPPFGNSHILMTNYPGEYVSSETAHATMINPKYKTMFGNVWIYMLTK